MEYEIYFKMLTKEAQEDIIKEMGVKNEKELFEETNWDVLPIASLEYLR